MNWIFVHGQENCVQDDAKGDEDVEHVHGHEDVEPFVHDP